MEVWNSRLWENLETPEFASLSHVLGTVRRVGLGGNVVYFHMAAQALYFVDEYVDQGPRIAFR